MAQCSLGSFVEDHLVRAPQPVEYFLRPPTVASNFSEDAAAPVATGAPDFTRPYSEGALKSKVKADFLNKLPPTIHASLEAPSDF